MHYCCGVSFNVAAALQFMLMKEVSLAIRIDKKILIDTDVTKPCHLVLILFYGNI